MRKAKIATLLYARAKTMTCASFLSPNAVGTLIREVSGTRTGSTLPTFARLALSPGRKSGRNCSGCPGFCCKSRTRRDYRPLDALRQGLDLEPDDFLGVTDARDRTRSQAASFGRVSRRAWEATQQSFSMLRVSGCGCNADTRQLTYSLSNYHGLAHDCAAREGIRTTFFLIAHHQGRQRPVSGPSHNSGPELPPRCCPCFRSLPWRGSCSCFFRDAGLHPRREPRRPLSWRMGRGPAS